MAAKKKNQDDAGLDDELYLDDDAGELEKLFATMEPANRPPPARKAQTGTWRSVEEYMEARRLQKTLSEEYDFDGED